jgi:hypothetical protein
VAQKYTKSRFVMSFVEVASMSFFLALLVQVIGPMFGLKVDAELTLQTIGSLSAFSSALILVPLVYVFVYGAVKFGLNPDNIAPPLITTCGDLITLPLILGSVTVSKWIGPRLETIVVVATPIIVLLLLYWVLKLITLSQLFKMIRYNELKAVNYVLHK